MEHFDADLAEFVDDWMLRGLAAFLACRAIKAFGVFLGSEYARAVNPFEDLPFVPPAQGSATAHRHGRERVGDAARVRRRLPWAARRGADLRRANMRDPRHAKVVLA